MSNSKFYRVFTFVFSKKEGEGGIYAPLNIYTSAHPSGEVMSGTEQLLCENVQKRDIDGVVTHLYICLPSKYRKQKQIYKQKQW
jgi:hypothetical protein